MPPILPPDARPSTELMPPLQRRSRAMSGELAKGEQVQGEQGMAGELTIDLLAALRADFFKSEKNRLALNVCSRCSGLCNQA